MEQAGMNAPGTLRDAIAAEILALRTTAALMGLRR